MRKDTPSRTARKVALEIVTLGSKQGMEEVLPKGIVKSTADLLVASGAVGETAIRFARTKKAVSLYEAFDWMFPGQFEAFAHRKAFCELQVRKSIGEGAKQVLVLGAGYDTLGWRLAREFPGVFFVEIDHPATARYKSLGIKTMGQRKNLCLIAEDLGKRQLVDVLAATETWDQDAPAVFIAEGLVMYLPAKAVRELFCQCALIAGPNSRIAFSYIPAGADGRLDAGRWTFLMLWVQRMIGEPWLWSIRPDDLGQFLRESGWVDASALADGTGRYGMEYFTVAEKQA